MLVGTRYTQQEWDKYLKLIDDLGSENSEVEKAAPQQGMAMSSEERKRFDEFFAGEYRRYREKKFAESLDWSTEENRREILEILNKVPAILYGYTNSNNQVIASASAVASSGVTATMTQTAAIIHSRRKK